MQYITNKNLIQKLKDYKQNMDFRELSNKDHNLTIETINQFINLISVNDIDDDTNAPFEIPINFIDNFEYDDRITEIAEHVSPYKYSDLTAWLAYDNEHIRLVDEYVYNTQENDYKGINLANIISNTIINALKQDLIKILTTITK